jgi:nitrite reductase (NADH) small subunit
MPTNAHLKVVKKPMTVVTDNTHTTHTGAWIEVGRLDDIPRLGARVVCAPDGDIAVFRAADDHIFALRDQCPHRGGPLSQGIVHGHKVTCPLHNWNIDLQSGTAVAPDIGCAGVYPTRVENGVIFLSTAPLPSADCS